jgi:hypothetical protein
MRKMVIALALMCAACSGGAGVQTARAVITANSLYTAATVSGRHLMELGVLTPEAFAKADNDAYAVLLQVQVGQATVDQLITALAPLKGDK